MLRWSILAATGLVPIACSGKKIGGSDEPGPDNAAGMGGSRTAGSAGTASAGKPTAAGAGGMAGLGGAAGGASSTCTSPQLDPDSGLVSCAEGYEHRPVAVACQVSGGAPGELPSTGGVGGDGEGGGGVGQLPRANGTVSCWRNADVCLAFELGYCDEDNAGGGAPGVCRSGCIDDADCGAGFICICNGPSPTGGECVASDCATDSDCQSGSRCASYVDECGLPGFACQTANDECFGSEQCESGCWWNSTDNRRSCESSGCLIGRPFLVYDEVRVAPALASDAWRDGEGATPCLERLSAQERVSLAAYWTKMGQLEHASIAAFARFNLQLLSLGAPPELIEDCTRAMADETAHARLCFQLASAYAGHAVGPGPLDIDGSLAVQSLADIVDLVIVEGCFGETAAALDALDAAAAEIDPVIQQAYARVARDEQRHAELAFRFVRWALQRDLATVAPRLAAFAAAPEWREHGASDVALPCLQALLDQARASASPRSTSSDRWLAAEGVAV